MKSHETISVEIERALKKMIQVHNQYALTLVVHPLLERYLIESDKDFFMKMAEKANAHLEFGVDDALHLNEFCFYSTTSGQKLDAS